MSKSAAVTVSRCRLHIGGFGAVVAILVLLPSLALAANPEPVLRRSDQVDVRRLGKVSEDERSVLRIEWRAGLAGVEETRSVREMLDKLRRLETGINDVSHLVRNMPTHATAIATALPGAAAVPIAGEAPDTDNYDTRLVMANLAALTLVALWWFRRRKPVTQSQADSPAPTEHASPGVNLRTKAAPVTVSPVTTLTRLPEAKAPSGVAASAASEVKAPTGFAATVTPVPVAEAAAKPGDETAHNAPVASTPETRPSESFAADQTMIFDFSLEEADPDVIARENAKLQAMRPASPVEPLPIAPAAQKTDVEPTLQLAEIMLSMGLEQGAAQTLVEYTEANPRTALHHWLKLLGIYRKRGLHQEFRAAAENLRRNFNIHAQYLQKSHTGEMPTLENFSRVAQHVQEIWPRKGECIDYLGRLLEDNRDGERAGFPQTVAEEILLLIGILKDTSGDGQTAGT